GRVAESAADSANSCAGNRPCQAAGQDAGAAGRADVAPTGAAGLGLPDRASGNRPCQDTGAAGRADGAPPGAAELGLTDRSSDNRPSQPAGQGTGATGRAAGAVDAPGSGASSPGAGLSARRPQRQWAASVTTVNTSNSGPLAAYLQRTASPVILAQEHHRRGSRLANFEADLAALGWRAAWAPALEGAGADGTVGGTAVVVRSDIPIAGVDAAPGGVLVPGRAAAAHVEWGTPMGLVCVSIYLRTGEGLSPENTAILARVFGFLRRLSARGQPWLLGGDFNMEPEALFKNDWLAKVDATVIRPCVPTCRQAQPGTVIDYFIVPTWLRPRVRDTPLVDVTVDTWPQWPVVLSVLAAERAIVKRELREPRAPPAVPPVGCARFPRWLLWERAQRRIDAICDEDSLVLAWDGVLDGIEAELLERCDIVGPSRRSYEGRAGPVELHWKRVPWQPPQRPARPNSSAVALATAACWAQQVQRSRRFVERAMSQPTGHGSDAAPGGRQPQDVIPMAKVAAVITQMYTFLQRVAQRSDVLGKLEPAHASLFAAGFVAVSDPSYDRRLEELADAAEQAARHEQARLDREWRACRQAIAAGAGAAHRTSKVRQRLELPKITDLGAQPHQLADKALESWIAVWQHHRLPPPRPPPEASAWPELPPLSVDQLRRAALSSPTKTAVGPTSIPPRLLAQLSDEGLDVCCCLFEACERQLAWPAERIATALVRLPKKDGGSRLVGLLHTLIRWWSRARRPLAAAWERDHRAPHVWGNCSGRSSSDAAFDLNLQTETARALGLTSITVLIDVWKAFEMVAPTVLMAEAAALDLPLRLTWMLICVYTQPRFLLAHGSASRMVSTTQSIVDAATASAQLEPPLTALLEDLEELRLPVNVSKLGPVASHARAARAFQASARRLHIKPTDWMRNMGHELAGSRALRRREHERVRHVLARRGRLRILHGAVGPKVRKLQRTGLAPAAARGAGVSGVAPQALRQLRTLAGQLAGAKPAASLTMVLALQDDARFDPLHAATLGIVGRWAAWLRDRRGQLEPVSCAWQVVSAALEARPSWAAARGPMAAVWLSLQRVGWTMPAAHAIQSDLGAQYDPLPAPPAGPRPRTTPIAGLAARRCWPPQTSSRPSDASALSRRGRPSSRSAPRASGVPAWTRCRMSYGPPCMPTLAELPEPPCPPAIRRGDHAGPWRGTVHADGSGHAADVPELAQRTWSAFQISDMGIRCELFVTLARAERYGGAMAFEAGDGVDCLVSDHLSFVTEGLRWSARDASSRGTHARLWRRLRSAIAWRADAAAPDFRWAPSHLTAEEALHRGVPLIDWIGNAWADWFASAAMWQVRLAPGLARNLELRLQHVLSVVEFHAWASVQVYSSGL
ncbi:unnamed protein product, partial [Prorocentrum cordatum]